MVCPYCNNHPIPNVAACNHCGVILKIAKAGGKRAPWTPSAMRNILPVGLMQTSRLNGERNKLQNEINALEEAHAKKLEAISQAQADAAASSGGGSSSTATATLAPTAIDADTRLETAVRLLISGSVEESLQQFEQAYRMRQGSRIDFLNNCGVAFARRGQSQLSIDRFQQAMQLAPEQFEPRVNLLYILGQIGHRETLQRVLAERDPIIYAAMASEPGVAARVALIKAQAGETDEAQRLVSRDISSGDKPVQADAHNDLGIVYALDNKQQEALAEFNQTIKIDAGHAAALANTGALYFLRGRFDEALQILEKAAHVDPHNSGIHNLLGATLCQMAFVNEGIRAFREARAHQMSAWEPYYNLAKVYIENDVLDEAERNLARANELNPYSWHVLIGQATLLYKQNNIAKALAMFEQAYRAQPGEPLILNGIALCKTLTGDYLSGEAYFKRALEASPNDLDLRINLSWNYLSAGDIRQAHEVLEAIRSEQDKTGIINDHLGLCQMQMAAYDTAEQHFKSALKIDANIFGVHYNLGCDYVLQNSPNRSAPEWEEAKKTESGNADLFANLGVAYYKASHYDKAAPELRRALHLRTDRMEDYANYGLCLARLKRHKEAMQQFEAAIKIEPRNPMLHSNLGLAAYFNGDVEISVREWRMVSEISLEYARRRGAKQQTEYDDSIVDFVPLDFRTRALHTTPRLPNFLVPFVPGYRTGQWELVITNPDVLRLEQLKSQSESLDRSLRAMKIA